MEDVLFFADDNHELFMFAVRRMDKREICEAIEPLSNFV
jgi:hypothetical protein